MTTGKPKYGDDDFDLGAYLEDLDARVGQPDDLVERVKKLEGEVAAAVAALASLLSPKK